jgi:hypothetical protein
VTRGNFKNQLVSTQLRTVAHTEALSVVRDFDVREISGVHNNNNNSNSNNGNSNDEISLIVCRRTVMHLPDTPMYRFDLQSIGGKQRGNERSNITDGEESLNDDSATLLSVDRGSNNRRSRNTDRNGNGCLQACYLSLLWILVLYAVIVGSVSLPFAVGAFIGRQTTHALDFELQRPEPEDFATTGHTNGDGTVSLHDFTFPWTLHATLSRYGANPAATQSNRTLAPRDTYAGAALFVLSSSDAVGADKRSTFSYTVSADHSEGHMHLQAQGYWFADTLMSVTNSDPITVQLAVIVDTSDSSTASTVGTYSIVMRRLQTTSSSVGSGLPTITSVLSGKLTCRAPCYLPSAV